MGKKNSVNCGKIKLSGMLNFNEVFQIFIILHQMYNNASNLDGYCCKVSSVLELSNRFFFQAEESYKTVLASCVV